MNGTVYNLIQVLIIAFVTILIRFLPFLLFDHGEESPEWINYLGKVLPPAVMSVLLVYCIRNVNFLSGSHGLPELIGIGIAAGLQFWKGNVLISICVSTLLYMLMVQFIFV